MWKTVTIIGVGLIGGSIGLALRERKLAERVIGVGRRAASLRKAKQLGIVTATTLRLEEGVAEADLVVVATPIAQIVDQVCAAAAACRPGTLITDAGSTKGTIVASLNGQLPASIRFVGSHPLAGSEKSGPRPRRPICSRAVSSSSHRRGRLTTGGRRCRRFLVGSWSDRVHDESRGA